MLMCPRHHCELEPAYCQDSWRPEGYYVLGCGDCAYEKNLFTDRPPAVEWPLLTRAQYEVEMRARGKESFLYEQWKE